MLNHLAYVTHDVASTADFYTRILGMELASAIFDDQDRKHLHPRPERHPARLRLGSCALQIDAASGPTQTPRLM